MNPVIRCALLLLPALLLSGCYATMARVSPQIQGRLLHHGQPVSDAQVYIAREDQQGRCGEVPADARSASQGRFMLDETRQPEWVYPNPRVGSWTLCIAWQGHTYVGYSMSKLDYPPPSLSLSCDLSVPQQRQAEHVASVYGFCRSL